MRFELRDKSNNTLGGREIGKDNPLGLHVYAREVSGIDEGAYGGFALLGEKLGVVSSTYGGFLSVQSHKGNPVVFCIDKKVKAFSTPSPIGDKDSNITTERVGVLCVNRNKLTVDIGRNFAPAQGQLFDGYQVRFLEQDDEPWVCIGVYHNENRLLFNTILSGQLEANPYPNPYYHIAKDLKQLVEKKILNLVEIPAVKDEKARRDFEGTFSPGMNMVANPTGDNSHFIGGRKKLGEIGGVVVLKSNGQYGEPEFVYQAIMDGLEFIPAELMDEYIHLVEDQENRFRGNAELMRTLKDVLRSSKNLAPKPEDLCNCCGHPLVHHPNGYACVEAMTKMVPGGGYAEVVGFCTCKKFEAKSVK